MELVKPDKDKTIDTKRKSNVKVLDEETYEQSLDKIIQRDFFPELNKLRAQNEYLEATENNDIDRLRAISARYNMSQTPASAIATPASFETPNTVHDSPRNDRECLPENEPSVLGDGQPNKNNQYDPSDTTLDKFLAKHTSEDNESFEQIMEQARQRQREKYSYLYKKEEEQLKNSKTRLALPESKDGDQLMLEDRPAMVDTWKYRNKNALMYCPDGIDHSVQEKIDNKTYKPQQVQHVNTRFDKNPFPDDSCNSTVATVAAAKQNSKQGKIGVDGHEQIPSESPQVNGFGFVAATPSLVPGVDASPLMTWGSIDGTPFRLDASDTPITNNPSQVFKMPEPKKREQLGLALAEKVSRKHREKSRQARAQAAAMIGRSPSHVNTAKRLNTMSAAAQRFASQRLGIRTGSDKALLASYTPRSDSLASPSPYSSRTPSTTKQTTTPSRDVSLTDNLLNLPKR